VPLFSVEFKECSLNVGFSDILQNVVKDKRNFILIAVSLAIGFAGYKLAQYFGKEEEKPAEDEERYKISSDMEILIKPKSLEKYEHEVGVKGLMVEEAWFGERRLLEEYIVARDSGTAERGDWSQLRDVRVPFRFWTDKSALRLSSGYKPFLYRNAEKLENPYILLM
jgi:hypothetical protein